MIDCFIRAGDETEACLALPFLLDELDEWIPASHGWALNVIGEIEGAEGWHMNLCLLDPDLLPLIEATGLRIYPASPAVVWARGEPEPPQEV